MSRDFSLVGNLKSCLCSKLLSVTHLHSFPFRRFRINGKGKVPGPLQSPNIHIYSYSSSYMAPCVKCIKKKFWLFDDHCPGRYIFLYILLILRQLIRIIHRKH